MPQARIKVDDLIRSSGLRPFEVTRELRRRGIKPSASGRLPRASNSAVRDILDGSFARTRRQAAVAARTSGEVAPEDVAWPVVGTPKNIAYLSVEQVEAIHFELVRDFAAANDPIDPPGVRSEALLESAVSRPYTSLGGHLKYPTVEMAGAALFHALVLDHPFHNGNKRTGLVSLIAFLDANGLILDVEDNDLFAYVVNIAAHNLLGKTGSIGADLADQEMLEIADWLCSKTRKAERTEFPLQFRELRAILRRYGAEFQVLQGNRINIWIGDLKTQIGYQGEGREIDRNAIHKVRQDLQLDEEHHIDSAIFYREHREIPAFIVSYRDVLSRLARV